MEFRVLVTGGAGGIGLAITRRLIEDGAQVVVLDREALPDDVPAEGLTVDLSDAEATAEALASILGSGPILGLVNNVGMVRPASVEETALEDLAAVANLNLRTSLQCLQALLPGMKDAHFGRVVGISSRAAIGKELRTAYAASKAAIHGMTKTWALELGRFGVTVNAVGPGPIDTPLFRAVNPHNSPRTRAIIDAIPVRRMGTPEDVAEAVGFFMSPRAGFVTGQVLYVCGGMTVGLAG